MNNLLMQTLLGQLAPGVTPGMNIADRLSEMAQANPKLAPFLQQLQNQPPPVIEAQAEEFDTDSASAVDKRTQATTASYRKLKRLAREMFGELKELRARNEALANALGACQHCWGDDPGCRFCRGEGRPGTYVIDAAVFDQMIVPALPQWKERAALVRNQPNLTTQSSFKNNKSGEQSNAL